MPSITQAAAMAGVPPLQLVRWNHRYRLAGSAGGLTLSLDEGDMARMLRMCELVARGVPEAEAAERARHLDAGATAVTLPYRSSDLVAAAASMDVGRLDDVIYQGLSGDFGHQVDFWLMPELRRVGEDWASGDIDVGQEEFCSAGVVAALYARFRALPEPPRDAPRAAVGLPPREHHEIPLLALSVLLRKAGVSVRYLGPNVSLSRWTETAHELSPVAAVLAARSPAAARSASDVVGAIRPVLPESSIWLGGSYGHRVRRAQLTPDSFVDAARVIAEAAAHSASRREAS